MVGFLIVVKIGKSQMVASSPEENGRLVEVEPLLQIITIKAGAGISEKRPYVLSN